LGIGAEDYYCGGIGHCGGAGSYGMRLTCERKRPSWRVAFGVFLGDEVIL
jgi:hypothetical protein